MAPIERELRLFDELDRLLGAYDLVVPDAVRRELDDLAEAGTGLEGRAASVGRDLADRAETVATAATSADDAMLELAESGAADLVATMDRPLVERVLAAGVPAISARGHHTLEVIQP